MRKRIGHIGIAVRNIEEVLKRFCDVFGFDMPEVRDVKDRKIKVALLEFENVSLEFLEDYGGESPLFRLVSERGNFIHHFALLSEELDSDVQLLKEKMVPMLDSTPRVGLRGKRIIFISPEALSGIPVELSEP